jgi:hypothetical protein
MVDTDKQMGRLFAASAVFSALMFFALAVLDGESSWRMGFLGAVSGWFLAASCLMALGDARAQLNAKREKIADKNGDLT